MQLSEGSAMIADALGVHLEPSLETSEDDAILGWSEPIAV